MTYTAQPLPGYKCLVQLASGSTVGADLVLTNAGDNQTFNVGLADIHRYLDRSVAPVVQTECDEIQTVTITGGPTGGTFTLTFGANTTAAIAYNAAASAVQSALTAIASIGANNVSVSGPNGGPWVVEFVGGKANHSEALMTGNGAALTGGSSPGVSITETQAGFTYTLLASGNYTLRNLTAQVVLNTPYLGANVNCRLHSFNYYPYAPIVQAMDITYTGTTTMLDVTAFQGPSGAGFISVIPGLISGVFACKAWQLTPGSMVYVSHLTARDLLILSFNEPNGTDAVEAYCYIDSSNLLASLTTVAEEDLTFKVDSVISLL